MVKKIVWVAVALLTLSLVFAAQAALTNPLYLPLVYNQKPTATNTPIPTRTPTPTATKTPGACLSGKTSGVCITAIDYNPRTGGPLNEVLTLKNLSSSTVNLKDWRISSDSGNKYDINADFNLNANAIVKIWTKVGDNDADDIFMDRTEPFWNDHADCAYVKDEDRKTVDAICYEADTGLFFTPPDFRVP